MPPSCRLSPSAVPREPRRAVVVRVLALHLPAVVTDAVRLRNVSRLLIRPLKNGRLRDQHREGPAMPVAIAAHFFVAADLRPEPARTQLNSESLTFAFGRIE